MLALCRHRATRATRIPFVAVATIGALVTLSGCAWTGVGSAAVTPVPTVDPAATVVTIDGVELAWAERGETVVVKLWGDSCRDELSSVDAVAIDEVRVTFASPPGDSLCFQYLAQFPTGVRVPDSVTGLPLKVSVVLPADSDSKTISGFVLE